MNNRFGTDFYGECVAVVRVHGAMTHNGEAERAALWRALAEAHQRAARYLILDVRGADRFTASGINLLLFARNHWPMADERLCLCGPDARLELLLALCQLSEYFPCYEHLEDALAGLLTLPHAVAG